LNSILVRTLIGALNVLPAAYYRLLLFYDDVAALIIKNVVADVFRGHVDLVMLMLLPLLRCFWIFEALALNKRTFLFG
jgi:hypothetical protein